MTDNSTTEIKFKDKLYGRENELSYLSQAYEKAFDNCNQLVLVKGVSGAGKSSLINEFANSLDSDNVHFLIGKQDLSRNNPPYSTLLQAFNRLIAIWLNSPEHEIERVRSVLKRELGKEIYYLLEIFPDLAQLVQPEHYRPDDIGIAFKDHFGEVFLKFVNALGIIGERVVIFLDDLQWADSGTLDFLKLWLSEGNQNSIMWIGAYRENELSEESWLLNTGLLAEFYQDHVSTVRLGGLKLEVIIEMYRDVLEMKPERLSSFGELILQLTGGNPLFIKESIRFLMEDDVLTRNIETGLWDYDISRVEGFDKSGRTVDFIIRKMELLDLDTLEVIETGAAIGNRFNTAILSAILNRSQEEIITRLNECVENSIVEKVEDIVLSNSYQYRFSHDKMQNAAYSMMSEDQKERIHYAIGKTYQSALGHAAQERNIYDIVNQFNQCISFFDTENDRVKLVDMNLQAGKKAKAAGSFTQALNYFSVAIGVIESNRQEWGPDVIFNVYLESGEAAYLRSDFVSSVMFYESALKYASSNLEKAKVHHNFLVMYNGVSDMEAAWQSGLKVLELLEVNFPDKIGSFKILSQFFRIKWLMRGMTPEKLLGREDMKDKAAEQTILTLMEMIAAAWDRNPEILAYLVLKGFEILLKKGNSPIGYFGVSGYGALLGIGFKKYRKGWEYVKLGGRLTEKYDSMIFHGRGNFAVYGTYSHLIIHARENIAPLEDAFMFSKGAGDYNIAAYSSMILVENMRVTGVSLLDIIEKSNMFGQFVERTSNTDYIINHRSIALASKVLIGGYDKHKESIEATEKEMQDVDFTHIYYTWRIHMLKNYVILGMKQEAFDMMKTINEDGYSGLSSLEMNHFIYNCIACADRCEDNRRVHLKRLKKERREIAKKNKLNPVNYSQIYALVNALIGEVSENNEKIVEEYQNAIEAANKHGYSQNAALFSERLGNHYARNNQKVKALELLQKASDGYAEWGAKFKVELLENQIKELS